MKQKIILSTLLFFLVLVAFAAGSGSFDRAAFYTALSSENVDVVNTQILALQNVSIPEKEAYEGALLMKKAGVIKGSAKEKLAFFKAGRLKLESAILKDQNNIEFRFLRFIIQEHAPKIVKYKNDMNNDGEMIREHFKELPHSLQQFIIEYTKKSIALKIA